MKLHIEVTQEDIELGCKQKHDACMVHRALMRATEGAFPMISVSQSLIILADEDGRNEHLISPPNDVARRITAWDSGAVVLPFAFDIDLPIEVQA